MNSLSSLRKQGSMRSAWGIAILCILLLSRFSWGKDFDYIVATIPVGSQHKIILGSEIERAQRNFPKESVKKVFSRIVLATLLDFKAEELLFYRHVPKHRLDYVMAVIFSNVGGGRTAAYEGMKKKGSLRVRISWDEKLPPSFIDPALRKHKWPAIEISFPELPATFSEFEEGIRKKLDRVYHAITRKKVVETILQDECGLTGSWFPSPRDVAEFYKKHKEEFPKELFRSTIVEVTPRSEERAQVIALFRELESAFWKKFEASGHSEERSDEESQLHQIRKEFSSELVARLNGVDFHQHEVDFTARYVKPELYYFSHSQEADATFIPMYEYIDDEGIYHLWILQTQGVVLEDGSTQKFIRTCLLSRERELRLVRWFRERLERISIRFTHRILRDPSHPLSTFGIADIEDEIFVTPHLNQELEKIFKIDFVCI